jgi:hypothetical protein
MSGCGSSYCEHQGSCNACCAAAAVASFAAIHVAVGVSGAGCAALPPPWDAACVILVGGLYIDSMISLGQAIDSCQARCAKLPP